MIGVGIIQSPRSGRRLFRYKQLKLEEIAVASGFPGFVKVSYY